MAYEPGPARYVQRLAGGDAGFRLGFAVCGLLLLLSLYPLAMLTESLWPQADITSVYSAFGGDSVKSLAGYFGAGQAPLAVVTLAVPGCAVTAGLLAVGLTDLASLGLVMLIGRRLYGSRAGLVAGAIFTAIIAFAQGYFQLTEPLALLLVLAATYLLLCSAWRRASLWAGLCVGAVICLKPWAVLLLPVLCVTLRGKGEWQAAKAVALALLPPAILFAALFAAHGTGFASTISGSSLEVAGTYLGDGSFRTGDSVMAVVSMLLSVCLLAGPLPLALLGTANRTLRDCDRFFLLACAAFIATLLVRDYAYYWYLALPFVALLCAGGIDVDAREKRMRHGP